MGKETLLSYRPSLTHFRRLKLDLVIVIIRYNLVHFLKIFPLQQFPFLYQLQLSDYLIKYIPMKTQREGGYIWLFIALVLKSKQNNNVFLFVGLITFIGWCIRLIVQTFQRQIVIFNLSAVVFSIFDSNKTFS